MWAFENHLLTQTLPYTYWLVFYTSARLNGLLAASESLYQEYISIV